jgi:medium-chain acyl-[acyl-carrier-protein] hydrolase
MSSFWWPTLKTAQRCSKTGREICRREASLPNGRRCREAGMQLTVVCGSATIAGTEVIGMGSPAHTWTDRRTIESFEIDRTGKLRAHVLFSFLLNSAWNHAREAAFDYATLSERNLMWVLSKLQLAVNRLPEWGDRIVIETWGKRIERFFALRDFIVTMADGERLASATSSWMILDRRTYRPQKLDQLMKDFPWKGDKSEIETNLRKVDEAPNAAPSGEFRVVFSDIDVNNHVTASRYLQWMMDSYPAAQAQRELKSAEISYLAEAVLDDRISVCRESRADHDLCRIQRDSDNQELCRSKLTWSKAAG